MKQIDMSIIPNGMLIEWYSLLLGWRPMILDGEQRIKMQGLNLRPALNYWHFNDGSMRLPDGLAVEAELRLAGLVKGFIKNSEIEFYEPLGSIDWTPLKHMAGDMAQGYQPIAVKILGLTPEYAHEAERLGMTVVEGV